MEFESFIFEFKRLYSPRSVQLTYRTLRFLLDQWHEGITPKEAVELVKEKKLA